MELRKGFNFPGYKCEPNLQASHFAASIEPQYQYQFFKDQNKQLVFRSDPAFKSRDNNREQAACGIQG